MAGGFKQRPCFAQHPTPQPEACHRCWLYVNRADYRRKWGGTCVSLGAATGGVRSCTTCAGNVRLKLFACSHPAHAPAVALRDCQTCTDYRPGDNP